MSIRTVGSHHYPPGEVLAAELERLELPFVRSRDVVHPLRLSAEDLIAALASSEEARLRLALIPLFIAYHDYARFVSSVADRLVGQARVTLVCYYTAATLLQRKYDEYLGQLGLDLTELPNIFGDSLGLPWSGDIDTLLVRLAEQQAQMSGRSLNWYGTYEYAIERFIRRRELEAKWAKS